AWPLKSRTTSQTASIGASRTVERTTLGMGREAPGRRTPSPAEALLQGVEAALEDTVADQVGQLAGALRRAVELGRPLGEGAVAVGHRRQLDPRDVVLDAHRRLQDRIAEVVVEVGEAEQLLADVAAVLEVEVAHAADAVGRQAVR